MFVENGGSFGWQPIGKLRVKFDLSRNKRQSHKRKTRITTSTHTHINTETLSLCRHSNSSAYMLCICICIQMNCWFPMHICLSIFTRVQATHISLFFCVLVCCVARWSSKSIDSLNDLHLCTHVSDIQIKYRTFGADITCRTNCSRISFVFAV